MTISIVEPTSKSPSKAAQTIPGVFFEQAARAGEREYLRFFRDGSWQALSWRETAERATRVACGLIAAGLQPGDHVALLSENRVEWLYCDLAILAAGGVTVPIYPSLTARVAGYIAEDSKTPLAIVSNAQLAEKLSGLDHPKRIFKMETDVVEWVQNAPGLEAERELASRLEALRPEAMATVVYTSGTTGDPKGVMLTHRHFVEMGKSALQAFHIGPEDRLLSYLPYSHVLERVDGIFIETMAGSSFWLARGMETLVEDIQAAKPTVMLGVPRVFEKVYEAVFDQVHNQPIYKRAIFRWALGIGAARLHREPGPWLGLRLRIADRLVLDSLRTRLTGGRLRFFISGGAPLNEKVEEFFWSIGVKILQGWGLTESTSGVTSNTEEEHRYRTVGKTLPGMAIRIETDGEILVKGPAVMLGYKNRPEATAEMIGDGWLKTGDMGFVDADGFLTITDRKKDLLKTSGGKYIAPLPIESQLENDRYVKASLVVGDQRPFVVALIVPDWEALRADTGLQGDPAALVVDPTLIARFSKTVDEVNTGLASFESVKYFALTDRDFTEAEGELTPTLKKKRRVIVEHFAGQIEAMYASHTR
ncbi:MAG TPA: long-chain fatty acid--CoA ligase [Candidatus Acidoferrum sp.]|nr:long-chain fatty acid--CoA ligase [Candidatus Acidoferrum sp.]